MTPHNSKLHHQLMNTMQTEGDKGYLANLVQLIQLRRQATEFTTSDEQALKRVCDEYIRKQLEMHAIYPSEIQKNACNICRHSFKVAQGETYCLNQKVDPGKIMIVPIAEARSNKGLCGTKAALLEIGEIL